MFICTSITPSVAVDTVEHSTMPISNGKTLYVGGTGEANYTTIQDAIDDASDGDTVFVYEDSSPYYESVKVNKSINLIGENRETTVIDGGGSGKPFSIHPNTNYVNISGFTMINSKFAGIAVRSSFNNISGNIITKNEHGGIVLYELTQNNTINGNIIFQNNVSGLVLLDSNNNTIIGNNITSNNGSGTFIEGDSNIIMGNIIHSNNHFGIINLECDNNNIIDNQICSNNDDGIHSVISRNVIITGNNIYRNQKDGIYFGFLAENTTISDNNISVNNRAGISFNGAKKSIITNNMISNNEYGIILDGFSSANTIFGNNITSNNRSGINLDYSDGNTITGNTISNNDKGVFINDSWDNIIQKNNFQSNKHDSSFLYDWFQILVLRRNSWKQNYWNRPRILPKLIFGNIEIGSIEIPWINIDWHPAKEPYKIGV